MGRILVEIDTAELVNFNLDNSSEIGFKINLVNKVKDLIIATDIEDFYVNHAPDYQEVILKIRNKKSDQ